jgi:gamma-glutamyltranspeptidase/glutathione hydrolase
VVAFEDQIMKMIEPYNLSEMGHNSVETIQLIPKQNRAYADRNSFLGDPDFVKLPVSELLDSTYQKQNERFFI